MAVQILGPYTQYEKPPPLVVTFQTSAGTAIDISGYDVEATWKLRGASGTPTTFVCALTGDGTDGQASVPWGTAPTSPFANAGVVEMEVWVTDSTVRLASERFRFRVRKPVATSEPS